MGLSFPRTIRVVRCLPEMQISYTSLPCLSTGILDSWCRIEGGGYDAPCRSRVSRPGCRVNHFTYPSLLVRTEYSYCGISAIEPSISGADHARERPRRTRSQTQRQDFLWLTSIEPDSYRLLIRYPDLHPGTHSGTHYTEK